MKNRLDQLFKEGISSIEVTPSASAREKFSAQIDQKSRKGFYWWSIAAAVAVLIVGVITMISIGYQASEVRLSERIELKSKTEPSTQNEYGKIDSSYAELQEPKIEPQGANQSLASIEEELPKKQPIVAFKGALKVTKDIEVIVKPDSIPLQRELLADVANDSLPGKETVLIAEIPIEKPKKKLPVVRITYKSGRSRQSKTFIAQNPDEPDTTRAKNGALNVILNSARNIANGSLIADLRDAKENFFNRNDD